jgi:hypothetical protein
MLLLQLLLQICRNIFFAVAAAYSTQDGQPATAALTAVCFKPFGTAR